MRLGLIGPAKKDVAVLRQRAEFVLDELHVDRAVYLGVDGILDEVVRSWASSLVGGEPSDLAVWERAVKSCCKAAHAEIDAFLSAERNRQRLKLLECLPNASARSIELFETVVAVLIHDKALLDEEDMLPASILVFGRSADPVVHRVGVRCFISPGPAGHERGGVVLLTDEDGEGVTASIFGKDGTRVQTELVARPNQAAHVTVQGA